MPMPSAVPNRRTVLAVGGGTAVAALVAACGSSPTSPAGSASQSTAPASSASGGTELAAVTDVPDGGALIVGDVVLARKGQTVTAHSAICTHQGCTVRAAASGDLVTCPCHGSEFTASTGAVQRPPAVTPLPAVAVTVKDGKIIRD